MAHIVHEHEPTNWPGAGLVSPISQLSEDGLVLTAAGVENRPRHHSGEQLRDVWDECWRAHPDAVAVDGPTGTSTYAELDRDATVVADRLATRGFGPGQRIGLLFSEPARAYAAMLAVLKLGAAYVPLDPAFPAERLAYIAADAELATILTDTELRAGLPVTHVDDLASQPSTRVADLPGAPVPGDELAYVIYTSGTTGRPKGVAVAHASICNFVRVAAGVYGVQPGDRVYQGLTIAFDFAVEEIWVAFLTGATLVPRPGSANLVGEELRDFLVSERVTALCCVPTLLATLADDVPSLRFVLVSGESCPADLVTRWSRPGRRLLNVYGPTEATVSATWTTLDPDRPVTIGVPLPTYSIVILDPESGRVLPAGQEGEIAVGGIGVADGYLNLPEKTAAAFIPDPIGVPHNPSGRLYRTGDIGLITAGGEVEHRGRIDTQVKLRGYRIETEEIATILRELPDIAHAVVVGASGGTELAAYAVATAGGIDRDRAAAHLRERLPAYMVPAYLEELESIPLLPSGKLDAAQLPAAATRLGGSGPHVPPAGELETVLASTLADVLAVDQVSVEADVFDELGVSSLLIARWTGRLRAYPAVPRPTIRAIYEARTVRVLAAALTERAASPERPASERAPLPEAVGRPRPVLCGLIQFLVFALYLSAIGLALDAAAGWVLTAGTVPAMYGRALACGAATLLGAGLVPIAVKWLLIGRFRRRRIAIWSLAYVRFWVVRTLIVSNPLARLLIGTALYGWYLRALGAEVGPGAMILTGHIPVATDLLRIGAGAVIRKDTWLNGYRALDGAIEFGAVAVGAGAFVGEQSVLDLDTAVGDRAELGHSSALLAGQRIPDGECWHGSPARPADPGWRYQTVGELTGSRLRRARHALLRLLVVLAVAAPLEVIAGALLLTHPRALGGLAPWGVPVVAAAIVLGALGLALLVAGIVPRLAARALEPGRVYRLYGWHHMLQRLAARTSNIPVLTSLFGDSSAITGYLRYLGYRLGRVLQTGSNFGTALKHEVPALCEVGRGTMVSDGLSCMNFELSSTAFRVMPVQIGPRNYLGNAVVWPAGAPVGENCLLATKVLMPVAGPTRHDVGLLGSPAFEIPRVTERHPDLDRLNGEPGRLRAKNRHNLLTALLTLAVEILFVSVLLATARIGDGLHGWGDLAATIGQGLADTLVFPLVVFALVDRAVTGFRPLRPRVCAVLQREFWAHERFWKVPSIVHIRLFDGTPLKWLAWRAHGVRVGGLIYDDGAAITERSLVTLGAGATLNVGATLQAHSLEDGIFKSDAIEVAPGATLGTAAFVHYGTRVGAGAVLEADTFLMKGSEPGAGERWQGNPGVEIHTPQPKGAAA